MDENNKNPNQNICILDFIVAVIIVIGLITMFLYIEAGENWPLMVFL